MLRELLPATRPAFLSISIVGWAIGTASAWPGAGGEACGHALAALALLLLIHAGTNALNDYHDHLTGCDALNTTRLAPFTGGSRFIQEGRLSPAQMHALAWSCLAAAMLGGLVLATRTGPGLYLIGLAGVVIAWGYSAPPLALASRGLGEAAVFAGFLLVVVGSDYALRRNFDWQAAGAGGSYALATTAVLYLNQFPDRPADRAAGKMNWVARLEPERAAHGLPLLLAGACLWLCLAARAGLVPVHGLFSLLGLLPAAAAAVVLARHARETARLAPAIRWNLLAAHLHGLLLAASLLNR